MNIIGGDLESNATINLSNPLNLNNASVDFAGQQNITLSGNGTLTGVNTLTLANYGQAVLSGTLSGSGSLVLAQPPGTDALNIQVGYSNLLITGQNTYTGGTTIVGSNDNIVVGSSSIGLTSGPFGTGPLTLTSATLYGDAKGETLTNPVTLNGSVTLAPSSMNGSSSSSSGLTFSGLVTLASNSTISVTSGGPGFVLSGNISGSGQLTVSGLGSLTLTGSANTYSGGTVFNAGNVATGLGTLTVANSSALGNGLLTLTGGTLRATSPITLQNLLSFTNGSTIGSSYVAFSGSPMTFSNSGNNLITSTANLIVNTNTTFNEKLVDGQSAGTLDLFSGSSTLFLQAADTFTGYTTVNSGTLVLDANGSLNTGAVFVDVGGTFTEDNTTAGGGNPLPAGRLLALSFGMNLNGGTFDLKGGTGGSTENFGFSGLVVQSGNSTIITDSSQTGSPATITTGISLQVFGGDSQLPDCGQPDPGQCLQSDRDWLVWRQPGFAGLVNGVLPYAVVTDHTAFNSGFNLATVSASGQVQALPQASYTPQGSLTYSSSDITANVLVTSSLALTTSDTVNAMLLVGDGITVSGAAGFTLGVGSGEIVSTGGTSTGNAVSVPNLAFGPAEGILYINAGKETVSSNITGVGWAHDQRPRQLDLADAQFELQQFQSSADGCRPDEQRPDRHV